MSILFFRCANRGVVFSEMGFLRQHCYQRSVYAANACYGEGALHWTCCHAGNGGHWRSKFFFKRITAKTLHVK